MPVQVIEPPPKSGEERPNLLLRNSLIIGAGVGAIAAYGERNWWAEGFDGQFKTVNEHWFSADTQYGGADKFGHLYANYAGVRLLSSLFNAAGNAREASLSLAMWSTLLTYSAIEVADGYSRHFRFSAQDFAANFAGAFFAYANEKDPRLDEIIDFRFSYRPSARDEHWDPVSDYPGQRYYLIVKADAFVTLRASRMTRYLEFAAGYGVQNYGSPGLGYSEPRRDLYLGLSVNLSRVVADTFYGGHRGSTPLQSAVDWAFELIQFPTAGYARHGL